MLGNTVCLTFLTFFTIHLGFQVCDGGCQKETARTHTAAEKVPELSQDEIIYFSRILCNFTGRYFAETMTSQLNRSVLISPLAVMLSYTPFVWFSEGHTYQQIYDTFGLNKKIMNDMIPKIISLLNVSESKTDRHIETLEMITGIYVTKEFHVTETFNDTMLKLLGIRPEIIDFGDPEQANDIVNAEIANRTHNLIQHLTNPDLYNVRNESIITISSFYFRGFWFSPFPNHRNKEDIFHSSTGPKMVTYMVDYELEPYEYDDDYELDCQILIKRYSTYSEYGCMFILPNAQDGLKDLIADLSDEDVLSVRMERRLAYGYVNVTLPKFDMQATWNVTGILTKMGIHDMYTDHADFHNVLQQADGDIADKKVRFSGSYQGVRFDINETGSDAAVTMRHFFVARRQLHDYYAFKADHPFVFVVFKRYLPLYIGVYDG